MWFVSQVHCMVSFQLWYCGLQAPEIISTRADPTPRSDLYSFGMLIVDLIRNFVIHDVPDREPLNRAGNVATVMEFIT